LTEFFAGSKKGLITGETDAKGTMRMNIVKEGRSVDFEFGGQVHDKGLRKKNVKRIESTLSDVLAMMINNVTSTNQFSEAMKDLSK
jgi:macrodomain Ter protein organizer (MatP/YcbG family)